MTRNAISVPADIMWKGLQSAVPAIFQNSLFYGCREATVFMKYHKGDPLAESRKEGAVYGRIPYEPGFLMILQVAKRIANVRCTVIRNYVNRKKSKSTAEKTLRKVCFFCGIFCLLLSHFLKLIS